MILYFYMNKLVNLYIEYNHHNPLYPLQNSRQLFLLFILCYRNRILYYGMFLNSLLENL